MKACTLGKAGRSAVTLDVARLIETRLLIQANSGGGKSLRSLGLIDYPQSGQVVACAVLFLND